MNSDWLRELFLEGHGIAISVGQTILPMLNGRVTMESLAIATVMQKLTEDVVEAFLCAHEKMNRYANPEPVA